jgi:pyrimidine-nucleoside phosphorylase
MTSTFDPRDVIAAKRDGRRLGEPEIQRFLAGAASGELPDDQVAALLMAVFLRGLDGGELLAWTRAMLDSGERLSWPREGGPLVDKHSTGGIGDKASLPLAPALAACGARVPMISGRGLGHTGGTLDKLEAIEGFETELGSGEHARCLAQAGWFIAAQTAQLVPADRRLYALRDRIAAVESIPLIASSILSKKLAEGLDALVLDVKFGSGAFLPEVERGRQLAATMVDLARGFGLSASALLTNMERPLGRSIGHALEVEESLECLSGAGPADLRELVCRLGGELLESTGLAAPGGGPARRARALDDGSARECFERGLAAQGARPGALERLPRSRSMELLRAGRSGFLGCGDLRLLGRAALELGGGRRRAGEGIDFAVGLRLLAQPGQELRAGDALLEIHHQGGRGLAAAREALERGLPIADGPPRFEPLVLERLAAPGAPQASGLHSPSAPTAP